MREAQSRLSSREFAEILAWSRVEPWAFEPEAYWGAAQLCLLANLHRDPEKKPEPYEIRDFWPSAERAEETEEAPDLGDKLRWLAQVSGRKVPEV